MIDPRIEIVRQAMLARHEESMKEDLTPGLDEYAAIAIAALDTWLIKQFYEGRAKGYDTPRLWGLKFCDCTQLVNEIMKRDTK